MDDTTRSDVVQRLKSAQGHLGGIVRMAEEDAYCIDLIHQIEAVQGALGRATELILENHLHTCMTEAVRGEDAGERQRVLGELVEVFAAGRRGTGRR
jgi:DNA-binding FrmR family transcriptional regulator